MRPFRFAIHLREFGWDPVVLTIAAPGQRLTPKESRLLKEVEVIEIKSPFDRTIRSESQLGVEPKTISTANAQRKKRDALSAQLVSSIDRQFPTDTWLLLFLAKYSELIDVVRRVRPDVLWSTGDPWSALEMTRRLAKRFDLPWVADFRDPWTLSEMRNRGKWKISQRIDERVERRIVSSADAIVFQATRVESAYRRHYADPELNTHTIFNSYDPCVFEDPLNFKTPGPGNLSKDTGAPSAGTEKIQDGARHVSTDGKLRIGFFGRFREMSPATLVIDALEVVTRRNSALASRIEIHSYGPLNKEDAAYAQSKGVLENFHQAEPVPLEHSLALLREFDLLLVSTDPSRDQIIPAKIFEYLAAGRPILSLSLNPEVADILKRTGTGIQLDPRHPESVAAFITESLRNYDEKRPLPLQFRPHAREIAQYEARNTTRDLARIFDSLAT